MSRQTDLAEPIPAGGRVSTAPTLQAKGIHKTYRTGAESRHVLKGLDLDLWPGELLAVVGPSGSGKSTLLHILGGLDRPTEGTVFCEGEQVFGQGDTELSAWRNRTVGFVFQFHYLLPEFTALENVLMPGLIGRGDARRLAPRASKLLAEVGVAQREKHRPSELSAGECQRVAVARALLTEPRILLADEPTGNLDRETALEVHVLLRNLCRVHGLSLVAVTHNEALAAMADRVVRLVDGKALRVSPPD
jgi:lipoprotein-releasing system ATP-binding protein